MRYRLLLAWLLLLPVDVAGDSRLVVSVVSGGDRPTWLGVIDLSLPSGDDARVVHLPISWQAGTAALSPGSYRLDHIDFTRTVAGDERTVRISPGPEVEVLADTVSYPGDLLLSDGEIRFLVNWETIDSLCKDGVIGEAWLNIAAPGTETRSMRDACDSVNLGNQR